MSKDSGVKKSTYIHMIIGVMLMFAGWFVPPFATVTEVGCKILFIFLGVIYLWSTVESTWSSLLAILAIGMSGYVKNVGAAVTAGFGNSTVVLVLFSMLLFGGLVESGIAKYIARFFLTRKISNGRPYVFMSVFTFGIFVVSAMTNVFSTLMLAWPLAYAILEELKYTKEESFSKFFVFCAFLGSIFGQITIPFRGSKIGLIQAFESAYGGSLNYLMFIVLDVVMVIIMIAGLMLLAKFVYRVDVTKMKSFTVDYFDKDPLPPMNNLQKFYLAVCFLYVLNILIPTVLNPTIPFVAFLNKIGTCGITIAWVILCCVLRIDGKPALNLQAVSAKHVKWDVIFLVIIAIMMSTALTAEATGIRPLIMGVVNPILEGKGVWGAGCILMVFGFLITNVANNFVCASIIMPIWGAYAAEAGISAAAAPGIATATLLCLYLAFLTPAASPYAGMLFGNRDWFTPAEIFKLAIPFAIYIIIVFCTIGYAASMFLFGLVA